MAFQWSKWHRLEGTVQALLIRVAQYCLSSAQLVKKSETSV